MAADARAGREAGDPSLSLTTLHMTDQATRRPTWEESVVAALERLGGGARLFELYETVRDGREALGLPLTRTFKATVRRTLQQSPRFERHPADGPGAWLLVEADDEP